jgi:hypothetical protein
MTLHPHQNIHDAIADQTLQYTEAAYFQTKYYLDRFYPNGIRRNGGSTSPQYETWIMATTIVGLFDSCLKRMDPSIRVQLETDPGKKAPNDVRGLILVAGKPKVLRMRISPSLVRIEKTEVFLDVPGGAMALLDVIRGELESRIKPATPGRK